MKGDFSQIRFNRDKHYTSVLQQQGRVALDADANEQCAIDDDLRRTETIDVIGEYGAPIDDAGFAITIEQNEIFIGPGRYYVAGLLCENPAGLSYGSQPYLIDPAPTDSTLLTELAQQNGTSVIQVFLQVWQRLVTALDDPCLREPALGQADTTARVQTIWRVVAGLVQQKKIIKEHLTPGSISVAKGIATVRRTFSSSGGQSGSGTPASVITLQNPESVALNPPAGVLGTIIQDCCLEMYKQITLHSTGTMSAAPSGGTTDCSCQPIPAAGYQGLENQLYRVEIHQAGDETSATFKWSRENGSVVAAIESISGSTIWVNSLGPDANLGFQPNQWVEITDDTYLFGQTPNQPGALYQIQSVDPTNLSITMTASVMPVDTSRNARVRRWDQTGTSAGPSGIPLAANTWLPLEKGIQVSFSAGTYHTGDYWTIPARTATGQIEWPPCGGNSASFQPPHSLVTYQAPLACIHWDPGKRTTVVESCRRLFSPLTALTAPATAQAMHITGISWTNDDVTTLDQLAANGLTVTFDQAPTGPVNGANFIVTFEIAAPPTRVNDQLAIGIAKATTEGLPSTILRSIMIVDAQITLKGTTLLWQVPYLNTNPAQRLTMLFLEELLSFGAPARWWGRARVKALGRALFSNSGNQQIFLDGQSFGQAAVRADGTTPRVDLQLPTGNGEKASDFESWFYVAPTLLLVSVTMNYTALTVVVNANNVVTGVVAPPPGGGNPGPVTPQVTVTVSYPVIAQTPVSLSLSGPSGVGSVASIPSSVNVGPNQTSTTFPVSILSNPGTDNTGKGITLTFQIIASLNSAIGPVGAQTVPFTVTGVAVPVQLQ